MYSYEDRIICEGSKERIGEEVVDQTIHFILVELFVRLETYTQLANGTICAHGSNIQLGSECSLHQEGCMMVLQAVPGLT